MKKKLLLFVSVVLLALGNVNAQSKSMDLEESQLLDLFGRGNYILIQSKIDVIDEKEDVFEKNIIVQFKDSTFSTGAYIASDKYQNRFRLKCRYVEIGSKTGEIITLDGKILRKKYPELTQRLVYLLENMIIKTDLESEQLTKNN